MRTAVDDSVFIPQDYFVSISINIPLHSCSRTFTVGVVFIKLLWDELEDDDVWQEMMGTLARPTTGTLSEDGRLEKER